MHEIVRLEKSSTKSIKMNFVYNLILRTLNIIFPIITFPYVARVLSPAGVGKVDFSISFIQYFILLAQVGIPTYGIKECSKYRNSKEILSKKVQEILIINVIMMGFSYIALAIVLNSQMNLFSYKNLIIIASMNIVGTTIGIEWFYQAIEEYKYITIRSIFIKILSVVAIFIFVRSEEDFVVYAIIVAMSVFSSYLINVVNSRKYINLFKIYQNYDFILHIRPIIVLFLMSASVSIYVNLDKLMLGFQSGDQYVGLYSAANKIIRLIIVLITSLGVVLLPRMSFSIKNGKFDTVNHIIKKSLDFILLIAIPSSVGIIVIADPLIRVFAGNQYLEAIKTMWILSPLILVISLSNLIGVQILVSFDKEKITAIATFFGALINLVLNYFLIPKYMHNGAAISSLIAEVIVLLIIIGGARKYLKNMLNLKNLLVYNFGSFLILVGGLFLSEIINGNYVKLIIILLYSITIYFSILLVSRNELVFLTMREVYTKVKSIINRK